MKTKTKFLALGVLAALPLIQACEAGAAWEGTVTDSGGVSIVNNTTTPLWQPGDEWTVTENLKIGTVAGEPEYQFTNLAFIDVGPDGAIYVTDNVVMEAKVFDANGKHLRTMGGPGNGPGELTSQAIFIFVEDDGTVIIPDIGALRVNRFSAEGEPMGSFPIDISGGAPAVWLLDDLGRLMSQIRGMNMPGIATLEGGDPIVVYDTTGTVVDTVAVLPQGQTYAGTSEQQLSIVIFAPEPVWGLASDGSVFYGMNNQFNILVNDPQGNLVRIIRKGVPEKPVEENDREAIIRTMREQIALLGAQPAQIDQFMQGVGFADFYPAFGQMLIGPEETIWAQRIRTAREMTEAAGEETEFDAQEIGSPEWEVFDAEGRFLGVVTLPDRFRPVNVTGDQIYGVYRDELDVQYVMRLQVNRPMN